MPSRIDIGPEGGPFVAINENSNDLELQDINGNVIAKWDETAGQWDLNSNDLTNINAIDAGSATFESLEAKTVGNDYLPINGYAGTSVEERLTAAINDAVDNQALLLERGNYGSDRTINKKLRLIGPNGIGGGGSAIIDGVWTFTDRAVASNLFVNNGSIDLGGVGGKVRDSLVAGSITIGDDSCAVLDCEHLGGSITFESGTSDGIADGLYGGFSGNVTDNGSNQKGSIQ